MDYALPLSVFYRQVLGYVDWTAADAARVVAAHPIVAPTFPALVDDFYDAIQRHVFTSRIITGGPAQIARLKSTLRQWLSSLFGGCYDLAFAESRWSVGLKHVEIGLHQAYALAALARLRSGIVRSLMAASSLRGGDLAETITAVNKLLDIDAAIIDFAYQQAHAGRLRQEAMIRVQQAERLASIGQMVTGLAHESRNALQRSHACLEALMLYIDDRPEAMVQAERIQKALDRLHVLYEEVRNYAAPIKLDSEPTDLAQLLKSAWGNLEPRRAIAHREVSCEFDGQAPCMANVDRHRLDQVFTNLFQNALDACGERGAIRCSIRQEDGESCSVVVEDSGSGISEPMRSKVFEPFFTTKAKGTGLGLAITQRIVDAHGGTIHVVPSDLGGAAFVLTIPCLSTGVHEAS